jgi:hypothetical protein
MAYHCKYSPGATRLVGFFAARGGTIPILMDRLAIHCRNRLQSLQRVRAAVEDAGNLSASEPSSGMEGLSSPSPSSFSTVSTPSSSAPLTPSLLKIHLPGEGPTQGNPSTGPAIPVYDRESDCRFNPPEENESFLISPQALQHGFPITIPTPNDGPAGCWQGTIPPTGLWKGCPPESSTVGENVQFYQPSQILAVCADPPTFNNSSPHPPIQFTMTCPVPHCYYQCQAVVEIWRHITWMHVRPQPGNGIEGIVEKVVLGDV